MPKSNVCSKQLHYVVLCFAILFDLNFMSLFQFPLLMCFKFLQKTDLDLDIS